MKALPPGGAVLSRFSSMGSRVSRAQRIAILSTGMLFGTALLGMFLIQIPWQERRQQMGADLDVEKQRSELLLSIKHRKDSLKKAEAALLLEGGTPALTSAISRLATESHLAVESVSPMADHAIPPYAQIQIEITATARLEDILRFLRSIESHRPLLTLNEIEISNAPFSEWDNPSREEEQKPANFEAHRDQQVKLLISALQRAEKSP